MSASQRTLLSVSLLSSSRLISITGCHTSLPFTSSNWARRRHSLGELFQPLQPCSSLSAAEARRRYLTALANWRTQGTFKIFVRRVPRSIFQASQDQGGATPC